MTDAISNYKLNLIKKVFFIFIISSIASCSQKKMYQLITKTPKIDYPKPSNFKSLNKFGKDAVYLTHVIETTYPRIFEKIPNFKEVSTEFIAKVSQINDEKTFDFELKRFISLLKDGHSTYDIDFSKYDKELFGLYLYREKKDWRIGNIDRSVDSSAIGTKVLYINNTAISEVEENIRRFESGENDEWKFYQFLNHFSFPTYWEAIGILDQNKTLHFVIEDKNGLQKNFILKASLKQTPYKITTAPQKHGYRFQKNNGFYSYFDKDNQFAYLQMNTSLDLVSIKDGIGNYTNFITKPLAMLFLKKKTQDAKNFGTFLSDFFTTVHSKNIKSVILDLSYNTGGDERTGKQFVYYIAKDKVVKPFEESIKVSQYFKKQIKNDYKTYNDLYFKKYGTNMPYKEINITKEFFDQPYFESITKAESPYYLNDSIPQFNGQLYVITGPKTFSAGQILATTIADNNLGKIVGKPTGNKPTTQTGSSGFKLPYTKKIIALSYFFMERPDKSKNNENSLFPDVEFYITLDEYMKGEDALMEFIINEGKKQP